MIDNPAQGLQLAKERLAAFQVTGGIGPDASCRICAGLVDAEFTLAGPTIGQLRLDLAAKGHLWQRAPTKIRRWDLSLLGGDDRGPQAGGPGSFGSMAVSLRGWLSLHAPCGQLCARSLLKGQYQAR